MKVRSRITDDLHPDDILDWNRVNPLFIVLMDIIDARRAAQAVVVSRSGSGKPTSSSSSIPGAPRAVVS